MRNSATAAATRAMSPTQIARVFAEIMVEVCFIYPHRTRLRVKICLIQDEVLFMTGFIFAFMSGLPAVSLATAGLLPDKSGQHNNDKQNDYV